MAAVSKSLLSRSSSTLHGISQPSSFPKPIRPATSTSSSSPKEPLLLYGPSPPYLSPISSRGVNAKIANWSSLYSPDPKINTSFPAALKTLANTSSMTELSSNGGVESSSLSFNLATQIPSRRSLAQRSRRSPQLPPQKPTSESPPATSTKLVPSSPLTSAAPPPSFQNGTPTATPSAILPAARQPSLNVVSSPASPTIPNLASSTNSMKNSPNRHQTRQQKKVPRKANGLDDGRACGV